MLIGSHRFFDASKQVWGSILVHIANLLLSLLSSGQLSTEPTPKTIGAMFRRHGEGEHDSEYHANPCSFYLLNLAIDVSPNTIMPSTIHAIDEIGYRQR